MKNLETLRITKKKKTSFSLTVKATVEHVGRISSLKKMCLADVSNMVFYPAKFLFDYNQHTTQKKTSVKKCKS